MSQVLEWVLLAAAIAEIFGGIYLAHRLLAKRQHRD